MDLSNNHRTALLNELKAALKLKETIKFRIDSEAAKNSLAFAECFEIEDYLNNERIKTIESALVDVEIDY